MIDVESVRNDFPILSKEIHRCPLVYLDNAATTQVPQAVLDAVTSHYLTANGNVHRAVHSMANMSTKAFESARDTVAHFIGAASSDNTVFTKGTTDALNMVALGLRDLINEDDAIISTVMEHHSNFIPWQQLAKEKRASFDIVDITDKGELDINDYKKKLQQKPKIVALTFCSNVLGTVNPIKKLVALAHEAGALVVVDGAQAMRHQRLNMIDLDCDYFAFSGHKMMAGTGIGCLYGKPEALELLKPSEFGGEMVDEVTVKRTTFEKLPIRLEAGTPNYVGAIALASAIKYLEQIGLQDIADYESSLLDYAEIELSGIKGIHIQGKPQRREGCISFVIDGVHPLDLCTLLDLKGIALRSGTNCAQPLMSRLSCNGVVRLSPAFYNTHNEIDEAIEQICKCSDKLRSVAIQ